MDNETRTTPTAMSLSRLPSEMRLDVWEAIAPSGRDAIMDCGVSPQDESHCKIITTLYHPDVLNARQSCHEAYTAWTKATIGTLLMPLRHRTLDSLSMLNFGVESMATLWPDPSALGNLYEVLLGRYQLDYSPTKTVYIGISTVVCDPRFSPIASSELGECKYRLFDLEDACLPSTCSGSARLAMPEMLANRPGLDAAVPNQDALNDETGLSGFKTIRGSI